MTASDVIRAPLSPAAASASSRSNNHSNRNSAAATNALNVRTPQVQRGADHDRAVARKVADLKEPQHQRSSEHDNEQVHMRRRRKRDVFFAIFKHASKHDAVVAAAQKTAAGVGVGATTTTATSSVPVQIPVGYTNPDHKGCLVSGRRVSYSRHMHQGRKAAIAKKLECAIPEDEQVLAFPATQLQREQELEQAREKAALEAAQNRSAIARSMFF